MNEMDQILEWTERAARWEDVDDMARRGPCRRADAALISALSSSLETTLKLCRAVISSAEDEERIARLLCGGDPVRVAESIVSRR